MKRLFSTIMALAMAVSLCMSALPVYAEGAPDEASVCTCTEQCAEGAVNDACPVCAEDLTQCTGKAAEPEKEPEAPQAPACTCTEQCTEGAVNDACPVCAEDLTQCTGKAAEPEKEPEAPQAPACTCTEQCTEGAVNDACLVCAEDLTQCAGKAVEPEKEPEEPQTPVCTCTERCTEGAVNDACPVCAADLTQCTGKAAEPEDPDNTPEQPAEVSVLREENVIEVKVSDETGLSAAIQQANNVASQGKSVKIVLTGDISLTNIGTAKEYFKLQNGADVHLTSAEGQVYTLKFGDEFLPTTKSVIMFYLDGSSLTLSNIVLDCNSVDPATSFESTAIKAESGSQVTINEGGKITNSCCHGPGSTAVVRVAFGSKLTMNGGEISGNDSTSRTNSSSAVILIFNSDFLMNGGEIKENAIRGNYPYSHLGMAGIIAVSSNMASNLAEDRRFPSHFVMNGGSITGNSNLGGYGGAISAGIANGGVYSPYSGFSIITINDGTISGNEAGSGGAISVGGSTNYKKYEGKCQLEINGGEISGNAAYVEGEESGDGGGAISARHHAQVIMKGGVIKDNFSDLSGGAIQLFNECTMEMYGGVIENNTANAHGGAICVASAFSDSDNTGSSLYLYGGTIQNNTASSLWSDEEHQDDPFAPGGGGIYLHGNNRLYIKGEAHIDGNHALKDGNGGGVYGCFGSVIEMDQGYIENNDTAQDGGGVYLDGTGSYEGYTHSYDEDSDGAGSLMRLRNGRIAGNVAEKNGGGLYIAGESTTTDSSGKFTRFRGGICSMTGGVITANTAKDMGGGVYLENDRSPNSAENAGRFIMTGGALYFNVAGENGNTSTGKADAGAELYAEGTRSRFTVPSAEDITAYLQDSGNTYVPEKDRSVWFTSWYDDYSDLDAEFGKADPDTWQTGRHTGRYMSSKTLDRMVYTPQSDDRGRRALILDRTTSLLLKKQTAGESVVPGETYTFRITVENLPDVTVAGERYPAVLTSSVSNTAVGQLSDGQQYLTFAADGSAQVQLKAEDTLQISGLPAGAIFHIVETDAGSAAAFAASAENTDSFLMDSASRAVSGVTQSVWKGNTAYTLSTVLVENRYVASPITTDTPSEPKTTPVPTAAPAAQPTSTAASAVIPQTGDESQPMMWAVLMGLSAMALVAMAVCRKKRSGK